jgi:porphobilinogen synthase
MNPANRKEAILESLADEAEGADILMVKPALAYLDVIREVKAWWPWMPLAAYNVSGEYLMVKSAAEKGLVDYNTMVLEVLVAIKRAGADMIITYHALEAAETLREQGLPF